MKRWVTQLCIGTFIDPSLKSEAPGSSRINRAWRYSIRARKHDGHVGCEVAPGRRGEPSCNATPFANIRGNPPRTVRQQHSTTASFAAVIPSHRSSTAPSLWKLPDPHAVASSAKRRRAVKKSGLPSGPVGGILRVRSPLLLSIPSQKHAPPVSGGVRRLPPLLSLMPDRATFARPRFALQRPVRLLWVCLMIVGGLHADEVAPPCCGPEFRVSGQFEHRLVATPAHAEAGADPGTFAQEIVGGHFVASVGGLPAGRYRVQVEAAETDHTGPDQRLMTVTCGKTSLADRLDLFRAAGGASKPFALSGGGGTRR